MATLKITVFLFFVSITLCGQEVSEKYTYFINKADSLFRVEKYKESSLAFVEAIKWTEGKAFVNHRYDAACAFALSGDKDKAFDQLYILARRASFDNYSYLATDMDLISLHSDTRWRPLLEIVKQNREQVFEKWPLVCQDAATEVSANKISAYIEKYVLDVNIKTSTKTVEVKGDIHVDFRGLDSLEVVLYRNTKIKNIGLKKENLVYSFNTISPSPIHYIPDGRKLTIYKQTDGQDKQTIHFDYVCYMDNVDGWGRSFSDEWIELGYYTAWYPVDINNRNIFSELMVTIDKPYIVSGSGLVTKEGDKWRISYPWPVFDNIIIASKDLKSKKVQFGSTVIETVYTNFPETDIDSVLRAFNDVVRFYEQIYGVQQSPYMKFVLCPTIGGGGYSRKNYVSLKTDKFGFNLKKGIAHEIAHFWWNKADVTTWEDWLNEAFSEYSMLLYIKEIQGQSIFNAYVDAYTVNASISCPLWGIDRARPEAYTALYEKGALILFEVHNRLGDKVFIPFLKKVLTNDIKTTKDFLQLVEAELGHDQRMWFEMKLKAKNNE